MPCRRPCARRDAHQPLPLKLTIALRPRSAGALQSFATAVSTPGSAAYRDYLSVAQFAQRFGAPAAQICRGSVDSSRAQGLTVGAPSANHLTLPVSGSVARVQSAFATKLSRVKLATGESTYLNSAAVALPASIAGAVQGVVGLDGAAIPRPPVRQGAGRTVPASPATPWRPRTRPGDRSRAPRRPPCRTPATPAISSPPPTTSRRTTSPVTSAQGQTVALFEEGAPYPQSDVGGSSRAATGRRREWSRSCPSTAAPVRTTPTTPTPSMATAR